MVYISEAVQKFLAVPWNGEKVFSQLRHETEGRRGDEDLDGASDNDETGSYKGQARASREGGGHKKSNGGLLSYPGETGVARCEHTIDEGGDCGEEKQFIAVVSGERSSKSAGGHREESEHHG